LNSLAESLNERAIGVILSGTGSDGTRGVRAINEVGGVALVQDPETAEFDGMPRSVIATELADYVLPPRELARAIYDYATNAPGGVIKAAADMPLETTLQEIVALVGRDQRVDFSHYKPSTLGRRIERRRVISGCGSGTGGAAQRPADQRHRIFPRSRCVGFCGAGGCASADRPDKGSRRAADLGDGLLKR
jgi:two-component system CheB/CheR fusion protein